MMQTNEGMIAAGIWRGCDYSSYFGQDWDFSNNMEDKQETRRDANKTYIW